MLDGKQIVLAADIPPDYLDLDDRMRTRFGMGLVVDIKAPTYEMKRSILKSFYERCRGRMQWCRTEIPDSLFDPMARLAPDNPRNMQGLYAHKSTIEERNKTISSEIGKFLNRNRDLLQIEKGDYLTPMVDKQSCNCKNLIM